MQDRTDDELIEDFLRSQTNGQKTHNPEFIVTNFDEPIPDVQFNPFPDNIYGFRNARDEDARSDYSALSQALSPGGSLLAHGDLLSNTGFNSAQNSPTVNIMQGNSNSQTGGSASFLMVPTQPSFSRNRSASICSSHSFASSLNLDGLELGDNYGEKSPYPGAQIVQVPSPWIQAINSPTQSVLSELPPLDCPENLDYPFSNLSDQISFVNFDDYLAKNNFAVDLGMNGLGSTLSIPSAENMSSISRIGSSETMHSVSNDPVEFLSPDETAPVNKTIYINNDSYHNNQSTTTEEPVSTTVPSGKFWKVVKQNGHTLYQCPFNDCEKTFTRPYNLKSHYRSHTGERPYVCSEPGCSSAFTRKNDLKRHSKLHRGGREYKCKACGKTFSRNDALARHLRPSEGEAQSVCAIKLDLEEREKRISIAEGANITVA